MRNKKGQFIKGHKPSLKDIEATRRYFRNKPKFRLQLMCKDCHKQYKVYPYRKESKFCSKSCRSIHTGKLRRDKSIPILLSTGYMYIRMPSYHRAKNGYAKIADLILEKKLGRSLKRKEIAHHIDGCKTNDSPENLQCMTKYEHDRYHLSFYHKSAKAPHDVL